MFTKAHSPAEKAVAPLIAGLEVFGDAWSFLLMQEAFFGVRRFDDFQKNLSIARNTLTDRLRLLEQHGIFRREAYQQFPVRYEYRLTERGLDEYSYAIMLMFWGNAWLRKNPSSISLTHIPCGARIQPVCRCSNCRKEIIAEEVAIDPKSVAVDRASTKRRVRYSSDPELFKAGRDTAAARTLSVIGDRWSFLLIWLAFASISQPERFHEVLGIARPILANRLNRLVQNGIFKRRPYSRRPLRHEYILSTKGKSLLPVLVTFFEWSTRSFGALQHASGVQHLCCGRPLRVEVACSHCGLPLKARDGRFEVKSVGATGRSTRLVHRSG
jgi:DNA-binding HxlR family transcriptional regulator